MPPADAPSPLTTTSVTVPVFIKFPVDASGKYVPSTPTSPLSDTTISLPLTSNVISSSFSLYDKLMLCHLSSYISSSPDKYAIALSDEFSVVTFLDSDC